MEGHSMFMNVKNIVKMAVLTRVVAHIYCPSTWEVEAGGCQVPGQPGLHSETVSK
jgi:hypothetical protein